MVCVCGVCADLMDCYLQNILWNALQDHPDKRCLVLKHFHLYIMCAVPECDVVVAKQFASLAAHKLNKNIKCNAMDHKPRILYHPDLCFDLAQQNVRETDRETRTAAQANKTWKQSIAKKIFFSPPSIRSEAGVTVREGEEKKSDWRCPPGENTLYLTCHLLSNFKCDNK